MKLVLNRLEDKHKRSNIYADDKTACSKLQTFNYFENSCNQWPTTSEKLHTIFNYLKLYKLHTITKKRKKNYKLNNWNEKTESDIMK